MVFGGLATLFHKRGLRFVAIAALLFSFAIETSQLSRAAWLETLRHTTLGALILGHGFLWSDLAAYSAGVALCAGLSFIVNRKSS